MTEAQPLEEQGGLQVRKPAGEKHVFKAPNPKSLLGELLLAERPWNDAA